MAGATRLASTELMVRARRRVNGTLASPLSSLLRVAANGAETSGFPPVFAAFSLCLLAVLSPGLAVIVSAPPTAVSPAVGA